MSVEAEKKFEEHEWENDKNWKLYYENVYPTPTAAQLDRIKRNYFRKYFDSNLGKCSIKDKQKQMKGEKASTMKIDIINYMILLKKYFKEFKLNQSLISNCMILASIISAYYHYMNGYDFNSLISADLMLIIGLYLRYVNRNSFVYGYKHFFAASLMRPEIQAGLVVATSYPITETISRLYMIIFLADLYKNYISIKLALSYVAKAYSNKGYLEVIILLLSLIRIVFGFKQLLQAFLFSQVVILLYTQNNETKIAFSNFHKTNKRLLNKATFLPSFVKDYYNNVSCIIKNMIKNSL